MIATTFVLVFALSLLVIALVVLALLKFTRRAEEEEGRMVQERQVWAGNRPPRLKYDGTPDRHRIKPKDVA